MLNQGEILTLNDNKKYTVVSSQVIDNNNYVYLIDQDDYTNFMFCKYDNNDGLEEVVDEELIEKLMVSFQKDISSNN